MRSMGNQGVDEISGTNVFRGCVGSIQLLINQPPCQSVARLAQWVERKAANLVAARSNPAVGVFHDHSQIECHVAHGYP